MKKGVNIIEQWTWLLRYRKVYEFVLHLYLDLTVNKTQVETVITFISKVIYLCIYQSIT